MRNDIRISEIIETIAEPGGQAEVCASADAEYDPGAQKVVVRLRSFVRRIGPGAAGGEEGRPWLPAGQEVGEHLPHEEVSTFAHDVFHNWVKRVRATIPHQGVG